MSLYQDLPRPDFPVSTPCFVILEDAVRHNLDQTATLAGGVDRLVPHIKTHRSPWLLDLQVRAGVTAFKAATLREVRLAADAQAKEVIWAYPTLNAAALSEFVDMARHYPATRFVGLVDSREGVQRWEEAVVTAPTNVGLRVDLDPGMGRTGISMDEKALELAVAVKDLGRWDGWHLYDGHIQDVDLNVRTQRVAQVQQRFAELAQRGVEQGCKDDLVAGGSYSFALWAKHTDARVSPGSWIYSSSQHQAELGDFGWKVGAYVLATVLSQRDGTVTLDAGSKAISPDMPLETRFYVDGRIRGIKEEHSIVETQSLTPGELVALVPRHACTTAYLYRNAWVQTQQGGWEQRPQLGCER